MTQTTINVALVGNPNCGKTTIFNQLCGTRQKTGNYPGVTVEKKTGLVFRGDTRFRIIDLPGTYSLNACSVDEEIAARYVLEEDYDVVINVVDGTNLERNLFLSSQLLELGVPVILAVNMFDEMELKGIVLDVEGFSRELGIPVVPTVGHTGTNISSLLDHVEQMKDRGLHCTEFFCSLNNELICEEVESVYSLLPSQLEQGNHVPLRWLAMRALEKDFYALETIAKLENRKEIEKAIKESNEKVQDLFEETPAYLIAESRYSRVGVWLERYISYNEPKADWGRRVDSLLLNRWLGLPMFFLVVYLLFQLVFTLGEYPMEWVEEGILSLQIWCSSFWPAGDDSALHSLIVDGILGGVGGVLVFVPNIVLLFLGIALLDSTGYIARAAFLMDRVMRNFGLHGKSFLPLMCGFGCTVPAIMATRCLDDEKDRLTTMMVLPLMSCGARLPIYSLFIPVFFPLEWRGLILLGIYFSGAALSIIAALLLRRTIFKGKGSIFMMELPPLRFPKVSYLFSEMWERTKLYLHKVATLILMASVVIWALARYPQLPEKELERQDAELNLNDEKFLKSLTDALPEKGQRLGILLMEQRRLESEFVLDSEEYKAAKLGMKTEMDFYKESFSYLSDSSESLSQSSLQQQVKTIVSQWKDQRHSLQTEHSAKQLKNTVMGRVGHWISPLFRPLGFDWRISTALLGALPAKELFVTQLGVLFGLGSEEEGKLGEKIKGEVYGKGHPREGQSIFPPLAGLCVMLFCLIASPCIGTIAATIRETNSYFWGVTQFAGLSILAYVVTLVVYQVGSYLKLGLV